MDTKIYTIISNRQLTGSVYEMTLEGDTSMITAPGQFVNIKLEGFYLRRPISICDWNENELTLVYKTVGQGTKAMSKMQPGTELDSCALWVTAMIWTRSRSSLYWQAAA